MSDAASTWTTLGPLAISGTTITGTTEVIDGTIRYIPPTYYWYPGAAPPATPAPDDQLAQLRQALDGLEYLWLTSGHETFGIECTVAIGDRDVTVTNQPDPISAILNARKALDAQG